MTFRDAITTCLQAKFFTFSGRASRSEYWYFMLFYLIAVAVPTLIFVVFVVATTGGNGDISQSAMLAYIIVCALISLFLFIPATSVIVRRFHDLGYSGWAYLGLTLAASIPFVGFLFSIAIIILTARRGTEGENEYGPDPLARPDPMSFFSENEYQPKRS